MTRTCSINIHLRDPIADPLTIFDQLLAGGCTLSLISPHVQCTSCLATTRTNGMQRIL